MDTIITVTDDVMIAHKHVIMFNDYSSTYMYMSRSIDCNC